MGTLSPAFGASISDYTFTVSNATAALTITPTLAQTDATLTLNGTPVASGAPSADIPLSVGVTPAAILVTAQDGGATTAYTVNITRPPLPFAQWQIAFFGSPDNPNAAPDEDPDFDGIVNLMEYVLGGIPVGTGSSDTSILPTHLTSATTFVFKFHRTKTATQEFSTAIEAASTLSQNDWAPVANETITVESIDRLTELVTATIPIVPAADGLFVRLRVQTNP